MAATPAARLVLFAAAVQQILAPVLIFPRGFGGFSQANSVPSPLEPAAYAFGIWGVIYTSCLIYGVLQLLPRYGGAPAIMAIHRFSVGLFVGSTAWLLAAKSGPSWLTVPIIWAMLSFALAAMLKLARWPTPLPRPTKLFVGWPLALYAGWLSVAAFVNTATVLPYWSGDTGGLGVDGLAMLMLAMATAAAAFVVHRSRGALPYALAVGWGLAGVAAANAGHVKDEGLLLRVLDNSASDVPPMLWLAGLALLALGAALAAARLRRPPVVHAAHHWHRQAAA